MFALKQTVFLGTGRLFCHNSALLFMCKSALCVCTKKLIDLENVISCDLIFWISRFKVP